MYKTLVVALDLTAEGDRALPIVEALARSGSVQVDLITVCEPGLPSTVDAWELERRAIRHGWTCDAWNVVHAEDAAAGIVQYAMRREDSLIVMATSARRPLTSMIAGSVPHDVLRSTDRPVLFVGPNALATLDPCTTLVVCLDATETAARAVPAIVAWQSTFVTDAPQLVEAVPQGVPDDEAARRRLVDMTELLAAQHIHADSHLLHDDVVAGVGALAGGFAGPVYVATSARYTDGRLHWHSTTQRLVHDATCPVLVVPTRPAAARIATGPAIADHVAFRDLTTPGSSVVERRVAT